MRRLSTELNDIVLRDDGIVTVRDRDAGIDRNYAVTVRAMDALAEFVGSERRPYLWDPRALKEVYAEGRMVVIDRIPRLATALAILVDDALEQVMAGFPDNVNQLLVPTRTYRDTESALAWLRTFLD